MLNNIFHFNNCSPFLLQSLQISFLCFRKIDSDSDVVQRQVLYMACGGGPVQRQALYMACGGGPVQHQALYMACSAMGHEDMM